MIDISLNIETGAARLARTTALKAGAEVPVRITLSSAPASQPLFELSLGPQSSSPAVKAYLADFEAESETIFLGLLDANDTRLVEYLEGKSTADMNLELVWTVGDDRRVTPNMPVAVQQRQIAGPETSEGGPSYRTDAANDARFALLTVAGKYRIKADGTFQIWNADQAKFHALAVIGAAGEEQLTIGAGEN